MLRGLRRLAKVRTMLGVNGRVTALEDQVSTLLGVHDRMSVLEDRVRALEAAPCPEVAALRSEMAVLQAGITSLQTPFNGLHVDVAVLRLGLAHSRRQLDLFKSSLEVPAELIDAFREWKANHPVPEQPLVSVCVATYNRARLLTRRCLPSVLGQTYRKLELIVVGDGCTDETEAAVRELGDPRLRFVNLPERGAYPTDPERRWMVAGTQAMNHAMTLARGEYVTHLDDDDEFMPDRLERLVAFAKAHACDFVWHPYWSESDTGEWSLNEAQDWERSQVTTSSVFYRSWFTRIPWDPEAHRLMEPGDWNRFRRIKYLQPVAMRYPEPLLRHYRERGQRP